MTEKLPATSAPKHIPIEDLIEYHKKGLTQRDIATLLGISQQAVQERLKKANLEGLERFSKNKPEVLEHKQRELLNSLSGDKIEKMSGYQLVGSASLLNEVIRNERGQASQIIEHRHIIADLRQARQRMVDAGLIVDVEDDKEIV